MTAVGSPAAYCFLHMESMSLIAGGPLEEILDDNIHFLNMNKHRSKSVCRKNTYQKNIAGCYNLDWGKQLDERYS